MKKLNQSGFVLAETLVVTVFLMTMLAMIYTNFYPLVGEYEKREVYDDVDGKYSVYWLKQMIESAAYDIQGDEVRAEQWNKYHYVRFECKDLMEEDSKTVCKDIVNSLQINGCDKKGNYCDIFITDYQIGNGTDDSPVLFKNVVKNNLVRNLENCSVTDCNTNFINKCTADNTANATNIDCDKLSKTKVFSGAFSDYIIALPDFKTPSLNYAQYRVIAIFHNTKDNNNYYSYATIEVNR